MTREEFCPNTYKEYAKIHGDFFESLKIYRDLRNVIDTAIKEGIEKHKRKIDTSLIKNLINMNFSIKRISDIVELSIEEVEELLKR